MKEKSVYVISVDTVLFTHKELENTSKLFMRERRLSTKSMIVDRKVAQFAIKCLKYFSSFPDVKDKKYFSDSWKLKNHMLSAHGNQSVLMQMFPNSQIRKYVLLFSI